MVLGDMTQEDGRLIREKMASWVIPTTNRSKNLEKSLLEMKKEKRGRVISGPGGGRSNPANVASGLQYSTPVIILGGRIGL